MGKERRTSKQKVRTRALQASRFLFRSRFLRPFLVRYIASKVEVYSTVTHPEVSVLLLDPERWWPDTLKRFSEKVNIYILPNIVRQQLLKLHLTDEDFACLRTYQFSKAGEQRKKRLIKFLRSFLPALAKRVSFDAIVSPSYFYVQNIPIAEACKGTSVPFIDVHKECNKDEVTGPLFKKKVARMNMDVRFRGDAICVYNQFTKDLLIDMGAAEMKDIFVTGTMRVDESMKALKEATDLGTRKTLTLFSFRQIPVGAKREEYPGQFSPDGKRGYVQLFENVHGAFAKMAQKHPQIRFVIKVKWRDIWEGKILEAIQKAGVDFDAVPNLEIISTEQSGAELIDESIAIVGFKTTALLEARLRGVTAITPHFDEVVDRYPLVPYTSIYDDFSVANSLEEFTAILQSCIDVPPAFSPVSEKLMHKYFGYKDAYSLDRVVSVLRFITGKAGKESVDFETLYR